MFVSHHMYVHFMYVHVYCVCDSLWHYKTTTICGATFISDTVILISFCSPATAKLMHIQSSELQRRQSGTFMEGDVCLAVCCLLIFPSRYAAPPDFVLPPGFGYLQVLNLDQ